MLTSTLPAGLPLYTDFANTSTYYGCVRQMAASPRNGRVDNGRLNNALDQLDSLQAIEGFDEPSGDLKRWSRTPTSAAEGPFLPQAKFAPQQGATF